jgi:hypothetical protein
MRLGVEVEKSFMQQLHKASSRKNLNPIYKVIDNIQVEPVESIEHVVPIVEPTQLVKLQNHPNLFNL